MEMRRAIAMPIPLLVPACLLLAGCGLGPANAANPSTAIQGRVFGGQQPIAHGIVTVWKASQTGSGSAATELAHVEADDDGNFTIPNGTYACPAPDTPVYITSSGGYANPAYPNPSILLAAGLGSCSTATTQFVVINEVTTVATAFALSHFFTTTFGGGSNNSFGSSAARLAYFKLSNRSTIPQLVDLPSGRARANEPGVTREPDRINTIADILATCVNDSSSFQQCSRLFSLTTDSLTGTVPSNTLQAAVVMALHPQQSVQDLFALIQGTAAPFASSPTAPSDWTLGIAYTSPNFGLSLNPSLPGGAGTSIDITTNGVVYFPSNAGGKAGIGSFDPSSAAFGNLSLAGKLSDPQYVVASANNILYASDLGSGMLGIANTTGTLQTTYTIAQDAASGGPITFYNAYPAVSYRSTTGRNVVQIVISAAVTLPLGYLDYSPTGIVMPNSNTLYAVSGESSAPCEVEGLIATIPSVYFHSTFATSPADCRSGGITIASNSGFAESVITSTNTTCTVALSGGSYQTMCDVVPGLNAPSGIASDSFSGLWTANSADSSVANIVAHTSYRHDGLLPGPAGIAVDGSGNLWISNAGCISTTTALCTPGSFTLTEIVGIAAPTATPRVAQVTASAAPSLRQSSAP